MVLKSLLDSGRAKYEILFFSCRWGESRFYPPSAKRRKVGRSASKPLPTKVDLRPYLTPVDEQVGMSCVANTFAGAYEYLAKRHLQKDSEVSRLFIYFNARAESDAQDLDEGTTLQEAIEALKNMVLVMNSFT